MLERIIRQREEQHVSFSPQTLTDHETEMTELKIVQRRQERWSVGIEGFFFLAVIASIYPYIYVAR